MDEDKKQQIMQDNGFIIINPENTWINHQKKALISVDYVTYSSLDNLQHTVAKFFATPTLITSDGLKSDPSHSLINKCFDVQKEFNLNDIKFNVEYCSETLLNLHSIIRFSLEKDDNTPKDTAKPNNIRKYPDFKAQADAFESELNKRKIEYISISW
jgi:hypothetical protein